jgi:hypothetical protein
MQKLDATIGIAGWFIFVPLIILSRLFETTGLIIGVAIYIVWLILYYSRGGGGGPSDSDEYSSWDPN